MSTFFLSLTNSKKIHHLPSLLLSDMFLFCSFILSHPLYFSYFIFFSPYLFKILSFLSPLFITTFLLLLALLTVSPNFVHGNLATELSESKASFVLGIYQTALEKLRAQVEHGNEEFHKLVELEAYKIVFEVSNIELGEKPVEVLEQEAKEKSLASSDDDGKAKKNSGEEILDLGVSEVSKHNSEENLIEIKRPGNAQFSVKVKKLGGFLHEKEELDIEGLWCEKEEKEEREEKVVKPSLSVKPNKVEEQRGQAAMRSGSKGIGHRKSANKDNVYCGGEEHYSPKVNSSQRVEGEGADLWSSPSPDNVWDFYSSKSENSPRLESFGSMRREKEWRRTLACMLFEERHNVDGGEGMDLLWEAYETESVKSKGKSTRSKKGKRNKFGSSRSEYSFCDSEEEEDEEEGKDGNLCCLQALKFSAGKMNLGMGKPNLVKISKAIKGIGWLHHLSKHGRKMHR